MKTEHVVRFIGGPRDGDSIPVSKEIIQRGLYRCDLCDEKIFGPPQEFKTFTYKIMPLHGGDEGGIIYWCFIPQDMTGNELIRKLHEGYTKGVP